MSRDTPPHCVMGPRPGRYARRYRLSAPALWHPSRGHPCAARMQSQLNTLRLQSSIFLATSCWNQPGPLWPLMAVMSVAGHWPVPLHMRQPSTSNSRLPLTAPGSHIIACAANISHSPSGVCSTAHAYARISPNQYSEEQQPLSRLFGGVCMPFQTFGAPVRCVFVLGPSLLLSHGASQSLVRLCAGQRTRSRRTRRVH